MVVNDLAQKKEMNDKEISHKIYVREQDKKNVDFALERGLKFQNEISQEKRRDAELAAKQVADFQKELAEKKNLELLRKREFSKWQEDIIHQKQQVLLQNR